MIRPFSERAPASVLGAVFLLALAAGSALHFAATPIDWPDTAVYIANGNGLFASGLMASYFYMPLYPILIHLSGPVGVLWLQAFISTATVVLAAAPAHQIFASRAAGIAAGVLIALHPRLTFYAGMRLSGIIFTFFEVAAFAAFYRERRWLGSVALVLGVLTEPALDLDGGVVMRLENNSTFDNAGLDFGAFRPVLDCDDIKDPVALNEAREAADYSYITAHPIHYLARPIERLERFLTPLPGSAKAPIEAIAFAATAPLYLGAVLCHAAAHALSRYRLPFEPVLAILAAGWYGPALAAIASSEMSGQSRSTSGPPLEDSTNGGGA